MLKIIAKILLPFVMAGMMAACGGGSTSGSTTSTGSASSGTTSGSGSSGGSSSPAASVTVYEAVSTSSVSWSAPVTYEDGSSLSPSELGGYKVYVGTTASNMTVDTTITDISTTEFQFTNLGKGIRYVSISSYDINGVESKLSENIVVNIS